MTVEFKNLVEKIVFDEDQLFQLKEVLSQLSAKKTDLKEVKQIILTQRTNISEAIIDLFSFYLNQQKLRLISSEGREIKNLQSKIKEREELLEEIGKRLELMTQKDSGVEKKKI